MLTGMHAGNYSMWLNLGGRGFDTAWEYGTQAEIAAAVIASGVDRSEIFITSKIPGSLYGGCCGCPGAKAPGEWPPCKPSCHDVCFPTSGHYTAQNVGVASARARARAMLSASSSSSPPSRLHCIPVVLMYMLSIT